MKWTCRLRATQLEEGRRQIDIHDHRLRRAPRGDERRIADQDGNPRALLIGESSLTTQAVLAVEESVVTGDDNHRVVERAHCLECRDESPGGIVHTEQHLEPTDDCVVRRAAPGAQGRQLSDLALQRGLPLDWGRRVGASLDGGPRIPSAVALGSHESTRLSRERLRASVIGLKDVRMHGLVGQVQKERLAPPQ